MHSPPIFNRGRVCPINASRSKARWAERIGSDHMNLVAVEGKALGEISDQDRCTVDRRKVGVG